MPFRHLLTRREWFYIAFRFDIGWMDSRLPSAELRDYHFIRHRLTGFFMPTALNPHDPWVRLPYHLWTVDQIHKMAVAGLLSETDRMDLIGEEGRYGAGRQ